MFEREFKELLEILYARLRAIQEAIKEKNSTDDNTQESEYVKRSDISRVTAVVIHPDEENEATRADREQTHGEQQQIIASQNRTANWTRRACIAAVIYGVIAAGQDLLVWRSLQATIAANKTAQDGLKQSRDQFEFLQAARLITNVGFQPGYLEVRPVRDVKAVTPLPPVQVPRMTIDIKNIGNSDATKIVYTYRVVERGLGNGERLIRTIINQKVTLDRPILPVGRENIFGMGNLLSTAVNPIVLNIPQPRARLQNATSFLEITGTVSFYDEFKYPQS